MENFVRKLWVPIVLLVLLFAFFYPFKIRIAPEWAARVIDENGKPVAQAHVEETWQEYSLEEVAHHDHQTTAADGIVHFEPHTMRASFASRLSGCLHNFRRTGVHTSCGAYSWVLASKCNYGELRTDWDRTQGNVWQGWARHMNATLFLRRCPPGSSGLGCFPYDERTPNLGCVNKSDR
jgi:hypothetical protein